MSEMTGGTARMVRRSPAPASQRSPTATQNSRMDAPGCGLRRSRSLLPPFAGGRVSLRAFQPFQRFDDLGSALHRLLTLLALAVDHLLRRASNEVGIGELGVDAGDVGIDTRQLLL